MNVFHFRQAVPRAVGAVAVAFLFGACSSDAGEVTDAGQDVSRDTLEGDVSVDGGDVSTDTVVTDTCRSQLGASVGVPVNTGTLEIHPSVAGDSEGYWVVHNGQGNGSDFAVFATHYGCDGSVLVPTMRVDEGGLNDLAPRAASHDGELFAVWQTDDPDQSFNLSINHRRIAGDGTFIDATPVRFQGTRQSVTVEGNTWMPSVQATDDGFVLAGAWGHADATAFQVFLQALDATGAPIGEAVDAYFDPLESQIYPDVAADANGDPVAVFVRTPLEGADAIYYSTSAADDEREVGTNLVTASLTGRPDGAIRIFGAPAPGAGDAVLIDPTSPNPLQTFGDNLQLPTIASGSTRDALLYFRDEGGLVAYVQAVNHEDDSIGAAIALDMGDFGAAYPPSVAHLEDDIFVVSWIEGSNPNFALVTQVVDLQ